VIGYFRPWLQLWAEQRGITAIEYSLIAGVLVVTIVLGFQALMTDLSDSFSNIGGSL